MRWYDELDDDGGTRNSKFIGNVNTRARRRIKYVEEKRRRRSIPRAVAHRETIYNG